MGQYGHSPHRFFELEQTPSRIQAFVSKALFSRKGCTAYLQLIMQMTSSSASYAMTQTACTQTHLEFSIFHFLFPILSLFLFLSLSFHLCIILQMKGIFGALTLWIHQHQTECKGIIWIMHTWKKTTKKKRLYTSLWSRDRGRILKSLPKRWWI